MTRLIFKEKPHHSGSEYLICQSVPPVRITSVCFRNFSYVAMSVMIIYLPVLIVRTINANIKNCNGKHPLPWASDFSSNLHENAVQPFPSPLMVQITFYRNWPTGLKRY